MTINKLAKACFLAGYLLLPFSTAPDDGFVVSFAIPVLFLFILFALPVIGKAHQSEFHEVLFVPFLVLLTITLTASISPNLLQSFARVVPNLIGGVVFLWIFVQVRSGALSLAFLEGVIIAAGTVLAMYYLVNMFLASLQFGFGNVILERYTGGLASLPWGASNVVSAVLVISLSAAGARWHQHDRRKILLSVSISLIVLGMIATLSRTAMVILIIFFIGKLLLEKQSRYSLLMVILLLSVLTASLIMAWMEFEPDSFELMSERIIGENLRSGNGRIESWSEKLIYLSDNILYPVGYYGSMQTFGGLSSHNLFLTLILEQSFIGLFINIAFLSAPFITYWKRGRERRHPIAKWYLFGLFVIVLNLQVEDANFTQQYILFFWAYMGLVYGAVFLRFRKSEKTVIPSARRTYQDIYSSRGSLRNSIGIMK